MEIPNLFSKSLLFALFIVAGVIIYCSYRSGQLQIIPKPLLEGSVLFRDADTWSGADHSGLVILLELSRPVVEKISKEGVAFLNSMHVPPTSKFHSWYKTPVPDGLLSINSEGCTYLIKTGGELACHIRATGLDLNLPPEISSRVSKALLTTGSYYSRGSGELFVIPSEGIVLYIYR